MTLNARSGLIGWVVLMAFVFGWDYQVARTGKGETLSTAFRQAARHPVARWPVIAVWTVTTLHLFGLLRPEIDPFLSIGGPKQ